MKRTIKIFWTLFFLGLIAAVVFVYMVSEGHLGFMPSMEELQNPKSAIASEIYDGDDNKIGKMFLENRAPVSYDEIAPHTIHALVSTEDVRFYDHSGIDARALGRAISGIVSGVRKGGASTITQQLAKNLFPRGEKKFLIYDKIKEMILAVKMERNLTKEEILTLYLNTVPFGYNSWGIRSAANTYFNKDPKELDIEEGAVLVGMLKANTLYNPKRNPEESKARRNVVLSQMVKNNKLSSTEYDILKGKDIELVFKPASVYKHEGLAPYFRQVVEEEVKKWCKKKDLSPYKDGLKIYTTVSPKMQQYAELAVTRNMAGKTKFSNRYLWSRDRYKSYLKRLIKGTPRYAMLKNEGFKEDEIMEEFEKPIKMTVFAWNNKREKEVTMSPSDSIKYMRSFAQCGFMAMDPASGEVKAWVGGINHKYFQYDHVNEKTKRQVGSTIKPLLYCFAVDNGYSPCSMVSCRPVFFPGHRLYNAGGSKFGKMEMKRALALSINNGTLYVLKQVGIKPFVSFIKKLGITSEVEEYPSVALGAEEISLYEMLRSYTMFPNYGINIKPTFISRIEDRNGNVLETFVPERKEVINEATAYKMIKMMQGTVNFGTAKRLKPRYGIRGEACGKTGTTNDEADAWYIGYTPQLLGGAWVGCEDRFIGVGMGEGSKAAMPIWGSFFKMVQNDSKLGYADVRKFAEPEGMEGMDICDNYDEISVQRSQSVQNVSRGMEKRDNDPENIEMPEEESAINERNRTQRNRRSNSN